MLHVLATRTVAKVFRVVRLPFRVRRGETTGMIIRGGKWWLNVGEPLGLSTWGDHSQVNEEGRSDALARAVLRRPPPWLARHLDGPRRR